MVRWHSYELYGPVHLMFYCLFLVETFQSVNFAYCRFLLIPYNYKSLTIYKNSELGMIYTAQKFYEKCHIQKSAWNFNCSRWKAYMGEIFVEYLYETLIPQSHWARISPNVVRIMIRSAFGLIRSAFVTFVLHSNWFVVEKNSKCIHTAFEVDSGSFEAKITSQPLDYVIFLINMLYIISILSSD